MTVKTLIAELDALEGDRATIERAKQVVVSLCRPGAEVTKAVQRNSWAICVASAQSMLTSNMPRSRARDALMQKHGISRTQAYRVLDAALNWIYLDRLGRAHAKR